jgi:hypothetical protein
MLGSARVQFVLLCAKLVKLHHFGWGLCCKIMMLQLKILAIFQDEKIYT